MVYAFKSGSHIKANPQIAGEMCERLAAEGRLTAAELVEENRPEDAPLHAAFEWDNDAAADKWREHQGRHIIASLTVKADRKEPVRAFFSVVRSDPTYTHIESILQSQDMTDLLLKTALAELTAFEKKYAALTALAGVFAAIDEVKSA